MRECDIVACDITSSPAAPCRNRAHSVCPPDSTHGPLALHRTCETVVAHSPTRPARISGASMVFDVMTVQLGARERRSTAGGRKEEATAKGNHQQNRYGQERHHQKELWHVRQDNGGIVNRDRTSPFDQWMRRGPSVVAGIEIAPAVEMKGSGVRAFDLVETGRTDKSGDQPDRNQQQGQQRHGLCTAAHRSGLMDASKRNLHESSPGSSGALTLRNRTGNCLPTPAHRCYRRGPRREVAEPFEGGPATSLLASERRSRPIRDPSIRHRVADHRGGAPSRIVETVQEGNLIERRHIFLIQEILDSES